MHVYLTGFMGVGKTTVGRALARLMNREFVDLDGRLEEQQDMSIKEMFRLRGESGFRDLESACLRGLPDDRPAVVALGGGVQTIVQNRTWLADHGTTVWLDLPLDDLLRRLGRQDRAQRPLFENEAQARELYEARLPSYSDSDLRIEVSSADSAERVAARIFGQVKDG